MEEAVVKIRLMEVDDLDSVIEVEQECFPSPWSHSVFFNEITKNQFAYYLVAELEGKVIGYCGLWVIVDEAHITNIAILPSMRRKGIGDYLFRGAIDMSRTLGAVKMSLEVRVSNTPAQALYRKYGFEDGGIRKNYYTDNQEDALVMWVGLS
ncbi:ribosomal-protein-alanine N-acetyltransferase [Salipaludibacillus keqinensis]|uniref:[Ribosomal protein bS18]-alanine N-acetyltransferase n=1 Tax=Salipaludibacillus keqinensis TaxID=2045207 RepID=A0A323TRZ3_9BACI|nr:ribosomal protein S18-alanine N-acetyltransferase [Salipaludibacillus keqinensis]PYZ92155.1 ribosomal-protein-alanine N-acetyltransferase [Salipaludibacillus keqinensis]